MKAHNRKALVFWMGLAVALAGVGVMRAGATPKREAKVVVERIVPVAVPAELAPCMMTACW